MKELINYLQLVHHSIGDKYISKVTFYPENAPFSMLAIDFNRDSEIILTTIASNQHWFLDTSDATFSGSELKTLIDKILELVLSERVEH